MKKEKKDEPIVDLVPVVFEAISVWYDAIEKKYFVTSKINGKRRTFVENHV